MKTRFYEHTAYRLSDEPAPPFFLKLDDLFDAHLPDDENAGLHPYVAYAESISSRIAAVDLYAFLIEDARKRQSLQEAEVNREADLRAAVLTHAFLLGYLGACRALLDSSAAVLAALYSLPVSGPACSLGHGDFWHQFVLRQPNIQRRYHTMRIFFNEVYQWCGETAGRIPPLALALEHFGQFARRETVLQVVDDRNATLARLAADAFSLGWSDPLLLHKRWKPQFLTLCEKLCQDIGQLLRQTARDA